MLTYTIVIAMPKFKNRGKFVDYLNIVGHNAILGTIDAVDNYNTIDTCNIFVRLLNDYYEYTQTK